MECAAGHGCRRTRGHRLLSTAVVMVNRLTNKEKIGEILGLVCLVFGSGLAMAGEVSVFVTDADGQPVPNVVVFIDQSGAAMDLQHRPDAAVMDQRDVSFVPHILVVQKGSTVEFPNSDVVAHHVYSFSRPNNFVLPLYKGTSPDPVTMTHDGVVTLGCNIHDGMLGYIVVVETNVFGKTDSAGVASLRVDDSASDYGINIWSPRIRDSKESLVQNVSVIPVDGVSFNLQKSLRPAHIDQSGAVAWDDY